MHSIVTQPHFFSIASENITYCLITPYLLHCTGSWNTQPLVAPEHPTGLTTSPLRGFCPRYQSRPTWAHWTPKLPAHPPPNPNLLYPNMPLQCWDSCKSIPAPPRKGKSKRRRRKMAQRSLWAPSSPGHPQYSISEFILNLLCHSQTSIPQE